MSSDTANIKNAASLLLKGGTLTGEACEKCGGVMIRFGEKTTCVGCGFEKTNPGSGQTGAPGPLEGAAPPSDLRSCAQIVERKVVQLAKDIGGEGDLALQTQRAGLMESYLRILEKLKSLGA